MIELQVPHLFYLFLLIIINVYKLCTKQIEMKFYMKEENRMSIL